MSATKEVQRIPSKEGLLLAAGGEGRLAEGQGRLRCVISLQYQRVHEDTETDRRIHEDEEIDSKPKGEAGAIEVPRRERVKRGPTTGRTRRSRSLVKTPDLHLNVKYQGALKNS